LARWLGFAFLFVSCGPDTPPRLGAFDAGPRDGSVFDQDGSTGSGRLDGGAVLPPADRVVVLAMGDPETSIRYAVDAEPAKLDVHINVDTTGSFVEEIDQVESTLGRDIIPSVRAVVPESSFGLSYFQDFPASPFGGPDDRPFVLLQRITSDDASIGRVVFQLDDRIGYGGDLPESGFESIYQIATGAGYVGGGLVVPRFSGGAAVGGGTIGGAGFREGSFRVVVHATDALSHDSFTYDSVFPGTHGRNDARAALVSRGIYFVGIANGGSPRDQLVELALATHAYVAPTSGSCPTGVDGAPLAPVGGVCPLVFDILADGTGLGSALVDGVTGLVSTIDFDEVVGAVEDDRLGFVRAVRATSATPPVGIPGPGTGDSTPSDGVPDSFVSVRAGTHLVFDLLLVNDAFPSQTYEQTFRVRLRIRADSAVVVDEWIRIVVPATAN